MLIEALQSELKTTVESIREIQLDLQKSAKARQQFLQQQHENEMVLKELELLDEDARVYKLIGPALIRQDQIEAKSNVKKRLEYISSEVSRIDAKVKTLEEKAQKKQSHIAELQTQAARINQAAQASSLETS